VPFRPSFDCLWCGQPHTVRQPTDLEGFALLCPDCIGRAQENPFLRFRLKAALSERARAAAPAVPGRPGPGADAPALPVRPGLGAQASVVPGRPGSGPETAGGSAAAGADTPGDAIAGGDEMIAYYEARAGEYDDWYLRRGRYSRGPLSDLAWQLDLDAATTWLDALPFRGEIVELAAGTGWWSPLLAQKGDLSIYDAAEAPLDRARDRLLAHRLKAHIHLRDAWDEPDREVDGLFTGFWLSHVPRARLDAFLRLAHRWLRPGGLYAFIDSRPDPDSGAVDQPCGDGDGTGGGAGDSALRRLRDGREFRIPKVFYTPDELEAALRAAGFRDANVGTTSRFFLLGQARA
jgi:SAM-dependent methyltransferase